MSTNEARSYHQQRGAVAAALNAKAKVDESVWADTEKQARLDEIKIEMKDVAARITTINADIGRMRADFARLGKRNPNYGKRLEEKSKLATRYAEIEKILMKRKQERRTHAAIKATRAPETKGDVFMRYAKMMLADDVFVKISEAAINEYVRLYE